MYFELWCLPLLFFAKSSCEFHIDLSWKLRKHLTSHALRLDKRTRRCLQGYWWDSRYSSQRKKRPDLRCMLKPRLECRTSSNQREFDLKEIKLIKSCWFTSKLLGRDYQLIASGYMLFHVRYFGITNICIQWSCTFCAVNQKAIVPRESAGDSSLWPRSRRCRKILSFPFHIYSQSRI